MNDSARRILGATLGAIIAVLYALLSTYINVLALPGVPLYAPEPGRLGSVLLAIPLGALIGAVAAWPEDVIPGVILATLTGAALSTALVLREYAGSSQAAGAFVILLFTFLPRTFLFIPMAGLLRWALSVWSQELQSLNYSIRRLALNALLLVVLASAAGAFSIYPQEGRQALQTTHDLIVAGRQASSSDELPSSLVKLDNFMPNRGSPYTLELSTNPDILPVQRAIAQFGENEYAVFARFENGFRFGCAFVPKNPPVCGNY